jgi:hypothetical protein
MAQYSPDQLRFLDETSKNNRTLWQKKKERQAQIKQVFVWGQQLSAEGLPTVEEIRASTIVEGLMK